jgi:DNA ligase 1
MPDLQDCQSVEIQGSARQTYTLKNVGGVYSCSCPAWRNQSLPIERRTCKHLRQFRGEQAELQRLGQFAPLEQAPQQKASRAPKLLLAETWDTTRDIADWWMSEKLDGVRALWDGRQFVSRQGNVFYAPTWFTASLPGVPLDGELWLARKAFQRTISIVRRHDQSELWREICFQVFDAPDLAEPFERRLGFLRDCFRTSRPRCAELLEQRLCYGTDHLHTELDRISALGGEGLMLRQPGSRYEAGRSATLLKVKRFQDAEARVIEHLAGSGRHRGRLGALLVQLADGTTFSVGTGLTDAQREHPPAVGSLITFRYQELTDGGVPRFPSFVRTCPEPVA